MTNVTPPSFWLKQIVRPNLTSVLSREGQWVSCTIVSPTTVAWAAFVLLSFKVVIVMTAPLSNQHLWIYKSITYLSPDQLSTLCASARRYLCAGVWSLSQRGKERLPMGALSSLSVPKWTACNGCNASSYEIFFTFHSQPLIWALWKQGWTILFTNGYSVISTVSDIYRDANNQHMH